MPLILFCDISELDSNYTGHMYSMSHLFVKCPNLFKDRKHIVTRNKWVKNNFLSIRKDVRTPPTN